MRENRRYYIAWPGPGGRVRPGARGPRRWLIRGAIAPTSPAGRLVVSVAHVFFRAGHDVVWVLFIVRATGVFSPDRPSHKVPPTLVISLLCSPVYIAIYVSARTHEKSKPKHNNNADNHKQHVHGSSFQATQSCFHRLRCRRIRNVHRAETAIARTTRHYPLVPTSGVGWTPRPIDDRCSRLRPGQAVSNRLIRGAERSTSPRPRRSSACRAWCTQQPADGLHECWQVPLAHLVLESGLWLLRSHFLNTVPVRLTARAMLHSSLTSR